MHDELCDNPVLLVVIKRDVDIFITWFSLTSDFPLYLYQMLHFKFH